MYRFIIKATKPKDRFYISDEGAEFVFFFCSGLVDLKKTMRCITPQGIKTKSGRWFLNRMRNEMLTLNHPLFKTMMFEIKKTQSVPKEIKKIDYTNNFGYNHTLKLVTAQTS